MLGFCLREHPIRTPMRVYASLARLGTETRQREKRTWESETTQHDTTQDRTLLYPSAHIPSYASQGLLPSFFLSSLSWLLAWFYRHRQCFSPPSLHDPPTHTPLNSNYGRASIYLPGHLATHLPSYYLWTFAPARIPLHIDPTLHGSRYV